MAYLNHRRSDQGREHAPVNWLVHMPGLHSADEFMQRSLNRVKELQETHQSPLVLNITVRDAASSCLRGAEARPTWRPCCPRPPLWCWRRHTAHTARRPWAAPWTHSPEQRKTEKNSENRSINNINKVLKTKEEEISLTLREDTHYEAMCSEQSCTANSEKKKILAQITRTDHRHLNQLIKNRTFSN